MAEVDFEHMLQRLGHSCVLSGGVWPSVGKWRGICRLSAIRTLTRSLISASDCRTLHISTERR